MNRNPTDYKKRLFSLALALGATAAMPIPEVEAAGSTELGLGEGASAKLGEIAAAIVADGEDRLTTAAPWDNVAWPESTWTQIIVPWPPKGPGVDAPAQVELESLASILDRVEG